jgi:hypothetical protein
MRIEARQPSYIGQLTVDDSKADFTDCHFQPNENPVYHFKPKEVVLWETEQWVMLGTTYESFWRPNQVDVVVSGKTTRQLHLVQLYRKDSSEPTEGRHEFLVVYPADGYWRAKPIPSLPMTASTYGSSFLLGPVEETVRPVVELAKLEFAPERMSFLLDYEDGSHGVLHIAEIDRARLVLDYRHDRPLPPTQPLAAIRSMFVTPERSDVADVSWQASADAPLTSQPIDTFTEARAVDALFGRSVVSTHNPSAPDLWFGAFVLRSGR